MGLCLLRIGGDGLLGNHAIIGALDSVALEVTLIAAVGLLIGGLDDLLADIVYGVSRLRSWRRAWKRPALDRDGGPMAVFIPAWDEADVIGPMLRTALTRYDHANYRIYVGAYPNDPATIAAVADIAGCDDRVHLVIVKQPGPTTKADCLNSLWRALLADEAAGEPVLAVVLHDAEDVVHSLELQLLAAHLADHDAAQLPVLPLPDPHSRFIAGHYIDEFAEAHIKALIVRQRLGAALPFAGVGCAIRRDMLGKIAEMRCGEPFDAASLTEDYELGLMVNALGGRSCFTRQRDSQGKLIAVQAFFPNTLAAAVRQKARWMMGIALAGWDRTGWKRGGSLGEHWMRMRDRRATLAIPVLSFAYLALLLWGINGVVHWVSGAPLSVPEGAMAWILGINVVMLTWRLALRMVFTGRAYGSRQALLSLPRVFVSNFVAIAAARRASSLYWRSLRGEPPNWDKTAHHFPENLVL